jgi:hypothetical protein
MATDVIDVASLETPGDSGAQIPDAGIVSSAETGLENQDSQQQPPPVGETPEEVTGKAIRDAIRRLSQQSPADAKLLKQLADTHFREATGWKGAFQTPQEAAQAKSIIESAGGIEGIAQAQTRLQAYDQQETGLESGDPAVLDSFFEDFPQGAAALAPHYLEKLDSLNPQALQAAVGPYAVSMLQQSGVVAHVDAMAAETDPARLAQMAKQLAEHLKGQVRNAQAVRQNMRPAADPRTDKLKAKETELQQREEKIFSDGVASHVNATIAQPFSAVVDQYAKQYKLNDTQKAHYRESLEQAVIKQMNGDKTYTDQVDLRKAQKNRTPDGIGTFIAGEFTGRAKDMAFEVAKAIYGAPKGTPGPVPGTGQVKAGQPQTAPGGGPLRISARPADSQLDLNRPNADLLLIKGQGYLKDGRLVSWR